MPSVTTGLGIIGAGIALVVAMAFLIAIIGDWWDLWRWYRRGRRLIMEAEQSREAAYDRAYALFLLVVTPEEVKQYERRPVLRVPSPHVPMMTYSLRLDTTYVYQGDSIVGHLCIGVDTPVPLLDRVIARKLWIETDEETFLETANWFPYSGAAQAPLDRLHMIQTEERTKERANDRSVTHA